MNPEKGTVTSKDGTTIAFEQSGRGPVVILVAAALADRADTSKLAKQLAEQFTVINYDRRGRGESSEVKPYTPAREVEDIEALIDGAGGSADLFASSSGAALALDAANQLGPKVKKLVLYEPPFIVDASRPAMDEGLADEIDRLVTEGRNKDAVKLFFTKGMGIPGVGVFFMRFMPGWSKMVGMAHTAAYDLKLLKGTQSGTALPSDRWSAVNALTLVMTGAKSEPFFHTGAKALADLLPDAQHRIMERQHHGSVVMAPKPFSEAVTAFFQR